MYDKKLCLLYFCNKIILFFLRRFSHIIFCSRTSNTNVMAFQLEYDRIEHPNSLLCSLCFFVLFKISIFCSLSTKILLKPTHQAAYPCSLHSCMVCFSIIILFFIFWWFNKLVIPLRLISLETRSILTISFKVYWI